MKPTHVIVAAPINCVRCEGRGTIQNESGASAVCPECKGEKLQQIAMPIEEFAKLFTYGQTWTSDAQGKTTGITNDIRVKDDR